MANRPKSFRDILHSLFPPKSWIQTCAVSRFSQGFWVPNSAILFFLFFLIESKIKPITLTYNLKAIITYFNFPKALVLSTGSILPFSATFDRRLVSGQLDYLCLSASLTTHVNCAVPWTSLSSLTSPLCCEGFILFLLSGTFSLMPFPVLLTFRSFSVCAYTICKLWEIVLLFTYFKLFAIIVSSGLFYSSHIL